MVGRRPTPETLESLNATLQKLEQTGGPTDDPSSIAELKRVLLNRIADLEIVQALEMSGVTADKPSESSELAPPPPTSVEDHLDEKTKAANLDKLD